MLLSKGEELVYGGFRVGRTGFGWFRVGRTGFGCFQLILLFSNWLPCMICSENTLTHVCFKVIFRTNHIYIKVFK